MSQGSDFSEAAKNARDIYEVIGASGATYIFFWFKDGSVTAAKRIATGSAIASAEYEFARNIKAALNDCGTHDVEGNTYKKGTELLKRLRGE